MNPMNWLSDPVTVAAIGGALLVGYYLLHWLLTRPGHNMYSAVGKRPEVARSLQFGRSCWIAVGTYAVKQAKKVGRAFVRANCHDQVGGTLVIELNEEIRAEELKNFPISRLVVGESPLVKHGLGNATIEEVNQPALRVRWAFDVKQSIVRFCAVLRRTGFLIFTYLGIFVHAAFEPTIMVCFMSTGGHLLLAMEAARQMRMKFPHADLYAVTVIPEQTKQQGELLKALRLHAKDPIFRLWIITDNRLGRDWNDEAVAKVLACIWQASRVSPHAPDAYNIMRTIYEPRAGDGGGGVAVLSHWERNDLAVYHSPLPPIDFLVNRDDVVTAVLDGIFALENQQHKCIQLATPRPGLQRFVIVNVALRQPYLEELREEIEQRLQEDGWFARDPNRSLIFSSLGETLTRSTRYITLSVALIEAARDGVAGLEQHLLDAQAAAMPVELVKAVELASQPSPDGVELAPVDK